ncbi:MAG: hypothetical protein AAFQ02_12810 [Bacteroidota bacterium]
MCRLLTLFIISLAPFLLLHSQAIDSIGCTGAVGDVKYSILDPVGFQGENGDCWVLMDGRDITGSRLSILTVQNIIPDTRGVFLRSYDTRTQIEGGAMDPDRVNNNDPVGSFQDQSIQSHHHFVPASAPSDDGTGNITNGSGSESGGGQNSNATGGDETRPKNIAFYTYIRIN